MTKVLLQIATKIGNVPWAPKIKKPSDSKIMMIGIDSGKSKDKHKIIAYCATINEKMSKFHSNYLYEEKNYIGSKMFEIVSRCLNAFGKANNYRPTEIVIVRNGCCDSQIPVKIEEIDEIKSVFKELPNYSPKLIYVIADKKPKQKFFLSSESNIKNPNFGTLINRKVVGFGYEFFLVSQNCNRGTAKPVYYKVIHNDSNFEEGILEDLLYAESFNYMNWSGSIRIPAPLMYAEKLVKFVSEHLNRPSETEFLNENLFFI